MCVHPDLKEEQRKQIYALSRVIVGRSHYLATRIFTNNSVLDFCSMFDNPSPYLLATVNIHDWL